MKIKINKASDRKFHASKLPEKIKPNKFYRRIDRGANRYYFLANENAGIIEIFSPVIISQDDDSEPEIIFRDYKWFAGFVSDTTLIEEIDCELEIIITEK
jgi:hypothetical protein